MATTLTNPMTNSYESEKGSVTFGTMTRSSIRITPRLDSARRTTTALIHTLHVSTYIDSADQEDVNTDATIDSLKKVLETPGGKLRLANIGLGNISVNVAGGQKDLIWGPIPINLAVENLGAGRAAKVDWQVEFALSPCDEDVQDSGLVAMEANYSVTIDIDKSGYSTVNVAGHVIIPQTRKTPASRRVDFSSDELREKYIPSIPFGFRRSGQNFKVSEDNNRLDFSYRDEEISPNVPPPGIVQVQASHDVRSMTLPNSIVTKWEANISASYEVAKDVPREICQSYFTTLLASRFPNAEAIDALLKRQLDAALADGKNIEQIKNFVGNIKKAVILYNLQYSEPEIYDHNRVASFNARYTFICPLKDVISVSGLWRPTPDTWQEWAASLKDSAWNARGTARLAHKGKMSSIIDLCEPRTNIIAQLNNANFAKPVGDGPGQRVLKGGLPGGAGGGGLGAGGARTLRRQVLPFQNRQPDPECSFLSYDCRIRVEAEDQVVEMLPLPRRARDVEPDSRSTPTSRRTFARPPSDDDGSGRRPPVARPGGPADPGRVFTTIKDDQSPLSRPYRKVSDSASIVQTRARPRYRVIFSGEAMRAGYDVPVPELVEVGGVEVVPNNRFGTDHVTQAELANYFGVSIYGLTFHLTYLLPEMPTGDIEIPKVPTK